jgi:hypothetical protein
MNEDLKTNNLKELVEVLQDISDTLSNRNVYLADIARSLRTIADKVGSM